MEEFCWKGRLVCREREKWEAEKDNEEDEDKGDF